MVGPFIVYALLDLLSMGLIEGFDLDLHLTIYAK